MATNKPSSFNCPNCNALYEVVKLQAGPETNDREITSGIAAIHSSAAKGAWSLSIFCCENAGRVQKWGKRRADSRSDPVQVELANTGADLPDR